jgi:DNA polymerase epsilon subunit 1
MEWMWRGEHLPAKRSEYNMIKNQLEHESVPDKNNNLVSFTQLPKNEQNEMIKKRLVDYCKKVYHKVHQATVIQKESIVCQRENPFYVNTVLNFRDRRYDYKKLHKDWKKKQDDANQEGNLAELDNAKKMVILYDSLQLAHKCILNSFYGYVMRKGARWYSMEMAGIVCLTGARIIQMARALVDQVGRPLELDTDGIWCILPQSFPENFKFKLVNGKSYSISYPCTMLNHLVHEKFTNDQYHNTINAETNEVEIKSENGIFFEVDGPYRAMILPSSKEENKQLKKRYAVFNMDGSLAELKGFEVKRRGELKLVKIFQSEIFKVFLEGGTLAECYQTVGQAANHWLDILYSKGANLTDGELFDLISENRSMSKSLAEYGEQKSSSISTARRLAEFLGDQMVKDKGLACQFIISEKPLGSPVTERAIPTAIFHAEEAVKKHYLRKWLKDGSMQNFDIRSILDWQYYLERLGSVIQKLITIPAAMQSVSNPVPRVKHPDWLQKVVNRLEDPYRQSKISDMFSRAKTKEVVSHSQASTVVEPDIEDIVPSGNGNQLGGRGVVHKKIVEPQEEPLPETLPNMFQEYDKWLVYQKKKWSRMLAKRRESEKRRSNDSRSGARFGRRTGDLLTEKWEVLQVAETDTPGVFKMWTLIGQQLYSLTLNVPRIFYINSICANTKMTNSNAYNVSKVFRHLPRSHQSYNLYEFSMTESVYRQNSKPLSSLFCHPDVVGVYELNVSLLFRALMELGCITVVDSTKMKLMSRSIFDTFSLGELTSDSSQRKSYLSEAKLNILFIHHIQKDSRHLITISSTREGALNVFVVGGNKEHNPNLRRIYQDKLEASTSNDDKENSSDEKGLHFRYENITTFQVEFASDENQAWNMLQKAVRRYQDQHFGPTMCVVSSPLSTPLLLDNVRSLKEFPMCRFPSHQSSLPALDWVRVACKLMLSQYFHLNTWISEQIDLAKYCNIPVGNLEQDTPIFIYDLQVARQLKEKEVVLWYSSSPKPDLGGKEDDEHRQSVLHSKATEVSVSGCFENVCVSLDVLNLAVNSVVESSLLVETEGTNMASTMDKGGKLVRTPLTDQNRPQTTLLDHITVTSPIFYTIKGLLRNWLCDLHEKDFRFPALLLEHFYRWISSPTSKLFDPALFGLVQSLMKRVLFHLVAEVKRRGCSIVFASFGHLILATTKPTIESSRAYIDYLVKDLTNMQIFSQLEIEPVQQWEYLMWMNYYNFGGIVNTTNEDGTPCAEQQVDMHWTIKEYLPRPIQDVFQVTVAEYIFEAHKFLYTYRRKTGKRVVNRQAITTNEEEEIVDPVSFKQTFVKSTLSRKLLNIIAEIASKQSEPSFASQFAFPHLPGSHLQLKNPALEFIKYVSHVLELDKAVENEVRVMKRNGLSLIGIREFSREATFQNPSSSFILPQVICNYCNYCRDMDICQDPIFTQQVVDSNGAVLPNSSTWLCPQCRNEYDKATIEESIVDRFQHRQVEYQMQDLKCTKCRNIKSCNIPELCECTGNYELCIPASSLQHQLETMRNFAHLYHMESLKNYLSWTGLSQVKSDK